MSYTEPSDTPDPVQVFRDHLTRPARHRLLITQPVVILIHQAAANGIDPADLARKVSTDITWSTPTNADACMRHRLTRLVHGDRDNIDGEAQ